MTSICGLCTWVSTKPGRTRRPPWSWRVQPVAGRVGLHGDDAAGFGEQPVIGAKAHRRRIDVAPRRVGAEIEQVAADGDACRGVGAARHGSRGKAGWHANRVYTIAQRESSSRPIRFFHRGAVVEIDRAAPTRTVLDWLREDARCTGTKEGCNEGDCGACTVVIGELAPTARSDDVVGGLRLRSANACIQFLPTLDGKALFTVEDLRRPDGALHPVQQAMVACHGSQCGFCTPGFVMSLWALYQHHAARGTRPSRQRDRRRAVRQPLPLHRLPADRRRRRTHVRPAARRRSTPRRSSPRSTRCSDAAPLRTRRREPAPSFIAPRNARRLRRRPCSAHPDARILAGSTDIGLWVNKVFRDLPRLLYIGAVGELKRIETRDGVLSIGAAASLEDAWRALVARWPHARRDVAALRRRAAAPHRERWAATSPTARRSATRRRC